jgi:hypothetical protein
MGKAETASREKSNQARPQVRAALALRIAVNREVGGTRAVLFVAVLLGIVFGLLPVLGGCGAARHQAPRVTAMVVLERGCLVSVALTEHAECSGPDLEHLNCTGLTLTKRVGCEKLRITR